MNLSRYALLIITTLLLALVVACDSSGDGGGNNNGTDDVVASVTIEVPYSGGETLLYDPATRQFRIPKGVNSTEFEIEITAYNASAEALSLSGKTVTINISGSNASFTATSIGDNSTWRIQAVEDYFDGTQGTKSAVLSVTVDGVDSPGSDDVNLKAECNLGEGFIMVDIDGTPAGPYSFRQEGARIIYSFFHDDNAEVDDTSITWSEQSGSVSYTGILTSNHSSYSGTHDAPPSGGNWTITEQ